MTNDISQPATNHRSSTHSTSSYPYLFGFVRPAPQSGEDAISPVVGGHIQATKHLGSSNGLGVHAHLLVWSSTLGHGFHQGVDAACLASTRGPQCHHAMAHILGLIQLDQLQHPGCVVNQTSFSHLQCQLCTSVQNQFTYITTKPAPIHHDKASPHSSLQSHFTFITIKLVYDQHYKTFSNSSLQGQFMFITIKSVHIHHYKASSHPSPQSNTHL